ncbi:MAG: hypothetical protein ACKV0T_12475 [Planctomycetales bacterium]
MIKLNRQRTTSAVPPSLRGDKRRGKEGELLKMWRDHLHSGADASPNWKTTYWKAGKPRLKKDTFGKCAYCESPTDVVAHGDVEHFRPKSVYWWLAYCFDNHLFACQICNQSYKGDNFPRPSGTLPMPGPAVKGTTTDAALALLVDSFAPDPVEVALGHTLDNFLAGCGAEQAGLPDPYNEDPELYFRWEADATNKEVWLRARTASGRQQFITESCEVFMGLNREELRRWRWVLAYEHLADLKAILDQLHAEEVPGLAKQLTEDAIRKMMAADQPYAAMVRFFVKDMWNLFPAS